METLTYDYPPGVTHTFKDGDYVKLKVPSFILRGEQKYQYYFNYLNAPNKSVGQNEWRVDLRNISLDQLKNGVIEMELTEAPKTPRYTNSNESNEISTYQAPSAAAIYAMNQTGGKRSRRKRKSRKSRKSRR
jgi:hypothetical protein